MTYETQNDLADATNGTIFRYDNRRLLKTRTAQTRYGNDKGINVVDMDTGEELIMKFIHDGFLLIERDAAFFSGEPESPTNVKRIGVDKDELREYLNLT